MGAACEAGVVLKGGDVEVEHVREGLGGDRSGQAETHGVLQLGDAGAEGAQLECEVLRVERPARTEAWEQPGFWLQVGMVIELLAGEDGDRLWEPEWSISNEEVEGIVFAANLVAAQRENLARGEAVYGDQQRCEARIEWDLAIADEGADDVLEMFLGHTERGLPMRKRRDFTFGSDLALCGPGEELWQPSSGAAKTDELFDLCVREIPELRLLLVDPSEKEFGAWSYPVPLDDLGRARLVE